MFDGVLVRVAVDVLVGVAVGARTVWLSVFDVTPATVAEAMFVTEPAAISMGVTLCVAVQVTVSKRSR